MSFLTEGQALYLDRLKRYAQLEWIETKPVRATKGKSTQSILTEEGRGIAKNIRNQDHVIVLDRTGKALDSEKLAARIERLSIHHGEVVFIIGGPLGLSKEILNRADETLSLSRFTLTHEMSRLILLEQIYRAFTIINHEKYHK